MSARAKPILMSAPMVRALLDGRKTQTRRVIKTSWWRCLDSEDPDDRAKALTMCPYGAPGQRLWVKETFGWVKGNGRRTVFRADGDPVRHDGSTIDGMKWKPSIFMPRHESRLTLEVTAVRVERVHDICENDAVAEGVEEIVDPERFWRWKNYMPERESSAVLCSLPSARESFWSLWESINGTASLSANPWVWVVSFRRVEP